MQQLLTAINQQNILTASLLLAERFISSERAGDYQQSLDDLISYARQAVADESDPQQVFFKLLNCFYRELAFSGNDKDLLASRYGLMNSVLNYRTGIPVTLGILFCHIAGEVGVKVSGVNFPGHFLLRCQLSEHKVLFANPLNGKIFTWRELEVMYFSMLEDADEEEMPAEILQPATNEQILLRLLKNLKAAFLREEKFTEALQTANLLVHLQPKNPYARRDRAVLLHQQDCLQAALADYQFFIRYCPQDPMTKILKLQLRHFCPDGHKTLH